MTLHEKARSLYESIRHLLGHHEPEPVQLALESELRHLIPVWTDQRPSCPGWYWHKAPGIGEPKLVLVDNGRIDTKLMADLGPPLHLVDVQRIPGQWAGPLDPPR
jgi:hypothetical protein